MPDAPLGPSDLVLSSGTVENPPLEELIEAALAGGYRGVTLWPSSYHPRFGGLPLAESARRLADAGLSVCDMDALVAWVGPDDPGGPYYEEAPERELFELAGAVGAESVNVLLAGSAPGLGIDAAAATLAAVCDRAAEHGLHVHIEFSRRRIAAHDLASAAQVVAACGRRNAGLLLDVWHVHYGPGGFDDLQAVDGALVTGFQINDAPPVAPADLDHATRFARLAPGQGCLDLAGFLRSLRKAGSAAPVSVEVFDADRVEVLGARAFAVQLADAVRKIQSEAALA